MYLAQLLPISRGLRVTKNAYFSLLTHTKQLLLVTFCDKTARSGVRFQTHGTRTDGQTDVKVEIVTVPAPLAVALD